MFFEVRDMAIENECRFCKYGRMHTQLIKMNGSKDYSQVTVVWCKVHKKNMPICGTCPHATAFSKELAEFLRRVVIEQ